MYRALRYSLLYGRRSASFTPSPVRVDFLGDCGIRLACIAEDARGFHDSSDLEPPAASLRPSPPRPIAATNGRAIQLRASGDKISDMPHQHRIDRAPEAIPDFPVV